MMISKWQTKYSGRPFAVCVEKDLKPLSSSKVPVDFPFFLLNSFVTRE